ncbi:MAG: hypothetical protein JSS72_09915 [Armatimonadetes bacterium]|nr:hypothetical protein [Armatimonadota bacterium]
MPWFQSKPKYLALNEYWVYHPKPEQLTQEKLLDWLLKENPYAPISGQEGLMFSDVRFHMALVLRKRNPHVFRPDVLIESANIESEMLAELADCEAMTLLRYNSEEPLKSRAHLRLLAFAVKGVASLQNGRLATDRTAARVFWVETLHQELLRDRSGEDIAMHLSVTWQNGHASTHGLAKIGLPEIVSHHAPEDRRVIVSAVIEEAARKMWQEATIPEALDLTIYDDPYRVTFAYEKKQLRARVARCLP